MQALLLCSYSLCHNRDKSELTWGSLVAQAKSSGACPVSKKPEKNCKGHRNANYLLLGIIIMAINSALCVLTQLILNTPIKQK